MLLSSEPLPLASDDASVRTTCDRPLAGGALRLTAESQMAHKRKLQKMQAEEVRSPLIALPSAVRLSLTGRAVRNAPGRGLHGGRGAAGAPCTSYFPRPFLCHHIAWTDSRPQASAIRFQPSDPRVLGTLQDPKLLLHQNRQMAHRLEELREEKRVAEAHIQRLDRKQRSFDTHLATIDQRWQGLDEDLRGVLARVDPAAGAPAAASVPASASAPDAPHRFLQRLLKQELTAEAVDEEEITQELKKRCTFTTNILQQVATGLSAKEHAAPAAETELRGQLDAWQHKATEASAKVGAVEGRLALAQQELQELRSKMDVTDDELEAAKRKVKILTFSLQDAKKDAANSKLSASTAGASGAASAGAASSAASAAGDANADVRVQDAEEAQRAAEQAAAARLRDSEELREQLSKAEQETVRLKQQLLEPQELVILRQPTYQCLAFEHAELDKSHTKLQEDYQQLQRELEASTASSQSSAAKVTAASTAARNEVLSQLQEAQKELSSVRTRYEEVQETMKRQASQPDRAAQVTELNKLVSALRTQLEKQKEEIKSRPRTSETAAMQQDLVVREAALTKQLKDNESKRSSLLSGKKKAEAALSEALKTAKKKEKDLVAKADELQIIINVLQNSSKEPRELTDLRSSEVSQPTLPAPCLSSLLHICSQLSSLPLLECRKRFHHASRLPKQTMRSLQRNVRCFEQRPRKPKSCATMLLLTPARKPRRRSLRAVVGQQRTWMHCGRGSARLRPSTSRRRRRRKGLYRSWMRLDRHLRRCRRRMRSCLRS
jgi:hypothetical protein